MLLYIRETCLDRESNGKLYNDKDCA